MSNISRKYAHPEFVVYNLMTSQARVLSNHVVKFPAYCVRRVAKSRHAQDMNSHELVDSGPVKLYSYWKFRRYLDVYDERGKYVYSYAEMGANDYYEKLNEREHRPYDVSTCGMRAFARMKDDGVILYLGKLKYVDDLKKIKSDWCDSWIDAMKRAEVESAWRDGEFVTIEGAKAWPYREGVTSRCRKCTRLIVREKRGDE